MIAAAGIVLCCAALQSVVGFAFGLFAVPLLLMLGLPLPVVVAATALSSLAQRAVAVTTLRRAIVWRELLPVAATSVIGLPLGVWLLRAVVDYPRERVTQGVGVLLLVVVVTQLVLKVPPQEQVRRRWALVAGFGSGILGGLAGISGPPVVLWVHAHRWDNNTVRVMTLANSLLLTPLQLGLLVAVMGTTVVRGMLLGVVLMVPVLIGTWAGMRIGQRLAPRHLRWLAYGLLLVLSIASIFKPYL